MLHLYIPGKPAQEFECLVLDMNGTLATDGRIPARVRDKINLLSRRLQVYVVTGDTRGDAEKKFARLRAGLVILEEEHQTTRKRDFVRQRGADHTVAIGNGYNDHLMLREAALGIAVIGAEGASAETLSCADVVVTSILDALDFILKPLRHRATLRN